MDNSTRNSLKRLLAEVRQARPVYWPNFLEDSNSDLNTGIPPLTQFSLTRFQLTRFFFFSSDSQAIITVGGAATKCQHQSPCYDNNCKACYDPLLRIHGKCGGASYFTCRGSLPRDCMPYTCTYRVSYENSKFRFGNS